MRYLTEPEIDDVALLADVAALPGPKHPPVVSALIPQIAGRYHLYHEHRGNPWRIEEDVSFQEKKDTFSYYYENPEPALEFINGQRASVAGACPMCGATGWGTLDHYLPKKTYPEFAFFSRNLVPACHKCNTLRRTAVKGGAEDQRPVHPFYEARLQRRLLTVVIEPPFDIPKFTLVPHAVPNDLLDAVEWHIDNIIVPAGFTRNCIQNWSCITARPILHVGADPDPNVIKENLLVQSFREAELKSSLNSWDSCFYFGVAQDPYAVDHISGLVREML